MFLTDKEAEVYFNKLVNLPKHDTETINGQIKIYNALSDLFNEIHMKGFQKGFAEGARVDMKNLLDDSKN